MDRSIDKENAERKGSSAYILKEVLFLTSYLVVKTGYEGIEELAYLTGDPKIAVKKLKELRKKDYEEQKKLEKEWNKDLPKEDRDSYSYTRQHVYNFWCIQEWDGKSFKCICRKLGIPPTEMMLR